MLFRKGQSTGKPSGGRVQLGLAYAILALASYKLLFADIPPEAGRGGADNTAPLDPKRAQAQTAPGVPAGRWWDVAKSLYGQLQSDRVLAVAGGVTYFGLLALFPTITALVSFYGVFNDRNQAAADLSVLSAMIPPGAFGIVNDQIERIVSGDGLALGIAGMVSLALALWSSNSGMKAMMDALNVAHGVAETRTFLALNFVSLLFTLTAIAFFLAMISVIAVVPAILNLFWLSKWTEWLIWIGRWPAAIMVVGFALSVLYRWGPALPDAKWRWVSPGSVLATLLLVILSLGFSIYAESFGKFNETYGTLGAAIAFMTWLWISCIAILLGAELNAELDRRSAV